MTLDEAIKANETLAIDLEASGQDRLAKAVKLGREALKMWGQVRENGRWPASTRLVGETFIPESVGKLPSDE